MNVNVEAPIKRPALATEADWVQWSANWIWRAVQCLVELPEFNPSPKWIASRLNITIEKSVEAIEGLERLGCIRKINGTFIPVHDWLQLTPKELSSEHLLNAQARIAPQILSKLQANDAYTSQFFVGDKQLIKKYSPKFMNLFKEMMAEAETNKCSEVIAAQISFVQLTGTQEEGAQ